MAISFIVVARKVSQALRPFHGLHGLARRAYRALVSSAVVGRMLEALAGTNSRAFFYLMTARFCARDLVGLDKAEDQRREYGRQFQDVTLILNSGVFPRLPLQAQVDAIVAIYQRLMSSAPRESVTIAEEIARHFRRLLSEPALAESMACQVYDCLYNLYFAGAQQLSDMGGFDAACVVPFEAWLQRKLPPERGVQPAPTGTMNICYFLHCAHFDKGNAVSPIVVSLARAHGQRRDRKVFLYCVQWVAEDFTAVFRDTNVVVRTFRQNSSYDRIDEIAAQLRGDTIHVAITDLNAGVAASLFTRRVAPLQMWAVMGYPYWTLAGLDWVLLIGMDHQAGFGIRRDRFSYVRVRQEAATLAQDCAEPELLEARAALPRGAFVFAVFSRLIKIGDAFLTTVARILEAAPRAHLLVVGTGDPRAIQDLVASPKLAGRVTFLHRNVDLNVYGRAIDAMLDTFPFPGGNACREIAVHGKPVLALLSPDWGRLLRDERDPQLLARGPDEFVALALRLVHDRAFYDARAAEAIRLTQHVVEMAGMVDDVEYAIAQAIGRSVA